MREQPAMRWFAKDGVDALYGIDGYDHGANVVPITQDEANQLIRAKRLRQEAQRAVVPSATGTDPVIAELARAVIELERRVDALSQSGGAGSVVLEDPRVAELKSALSTMAEHMMQHETYLQFILDHGVAKDGKSFQMLKAS